MENKKSEGGEYSGTTPKLVPKAQQRLSQKQFSPSSKAEPYHQ